MVGKNAAAHTFLTDEYPSTACFNSSDTVAGATPHVGLIRPASYAGRADFQATYVEADLY